MLNFKNSFEKYINPSLIFLIMLTDEIINGNHSFDIAEDIISCEVLQLSQVIENADGFFSHIKFDPSKHIAFDGKALKAAKKHTFKDLGIEKTHCAVIGEVAAVEPFPLFTEEAVEIMKWEVFLRPDIIRECGRRVNLSQGSTSRDFQVSGYVDKTLFTKEAMSHPKTLEIFSTLAGMNLAIPHVFGRGHINASLADRRGDQNAESIVDSHLVELLAKQDEDKEHIPSSVHWHYDSVPMVCVLMLEAPENMIGGETCIKKGNEDVVRIKGPRKGYATLLQGRVIKHMATKPLSNSDRISLVLSFVPGDPGIVDTTVAVSERPSATPSFLNDTFYPNYVNYKFSRIEQRLKNFRQKLIENSEKGGRFDQLHTIDFCKDIEEYLSGVYKNFEAIDDEPYPPSLFSIPYSDL
ncbi:uncharacterized protein PRCAT00004291001 [Priceomyces carsonii]|uniref:uncharacterized protein n=1 Tax=Priceomyces carsonii TaxID=28549 RepID=UPI002ED87CBB|nr:unnamed protein product [Priceomyces carsonii]